MGHHNRMSFFPSTHTPLNIILLTPDGWAFVPTCQAILLRTAAGCPLVKFISDTIYPEMVSNPTGWRLSPTRLPPTLSMLVTSPRLWPVFLTGYKLGVPMTSSACLIICYNRCQNSGKHFTCYDRFIIKDVIKETYEQPNGEVHRVRSGRVPGTGAPAPVEGSTTLLAHGCIHQPRSSPNLVF